MKELIVSVKTEIHCSDGKVFVTLRKKDSIIDLEAWAIEREHTQIFPIVKIRQFLILNNGNEIALPIDEVLNLLPDQTGVLVVFNKEPSKFSEVKEEPYFFKQPHNAAIYNIDGSLRFRLKNPLGEGTFILGINGSSPIKYPECLGVLVKSLNEQTSFVSLFALDCNSPNLTDAQQEIKY